MQHPEMRTDIRMQDVFFSWTGVDRDAKNRIAQYFQEHQLTVLESDYDCSGNFALWSREAASRCTVFLLLYTKDTPTSKYVPKEVAAFLEQDDWKNRIVPLVSEKELYQKQFPELELESMIEWDGTNLTDAVLQLLLHKVQDLIINRMRIQYREATKPSYLRLRSFLRMFHVRDREFDYESLYIPRTVTDENGNAFGDAAVFTNARDIFFLQGPGGSGKTSYIDQLRKAAGENTLVIALSCRKLLRSGNVFEAMMEEFARNCGNRLFFTREDMRTLLNKEHLLLVLDGMDEIATQSGKQQLLEAVSNYYNAHAATTTLFFTSRSKNDAHHIAMNGKTPRLLTLHPLEDSQIESFGAKLFLLFEQEEKSQSFYVSIKDLNQEIRANPLLLSQLAIIYEKNGKTPKTAVGICDAISEITLSREDNAANVPECYRDMVAFRLSEILKAFSAERYRQLSKGKEPSNQKILAAVLKGSYGDARERAEFLEGYLRDRALIVNGEFYHKMPLEYFTAVYYFDHCFYYDELENEQMLRELFSHYDDPYWSAVLQMFLVKADSLIDSEATKVLYTTLLSLGITEYTLLLENCSVLENHGEIARQTLLQDILEKSANGSYPAYGPLFWYVPEYSLYASLLLTLGNWEAEESFSKALALARDVCWIFGHYNTVREVTVGVDGEALLRRAKLQGARQAVSQLFFTGTTDAEGYNNIYPRCFNLAEAKHWKEQGCGIWGRMTEAFEDELGLYAHEMFSQLGGEYIGIVAAPYDRERLETLLPQKSCKKLCGLFLSPTEDCNFISLAINDTHVRQIYAPENTFSNPAFSNCALLNDGLLYFHKKAVIPQGLTEISEYAFEGCNSLISITIPGTVKKIGSWAFSGCTELPQITISEGVTQIGGSAFYGCSSLESVIIEGNVTILNRFTFAGCSSLTSITIPDSVTRIVEGAFRDCSALKSVRIPNGMTTFGYAVFQDCTALKRIENCPVGFGHRELGVSEDCVICERKRLNGGILIVPDGTLNIAAWSYSHRRDVYEVVMPKGVNVIGESAFYGCSSLTSVTIPEGVRAIGESAFQGCSSLTSITIPEGVRAIGGSAFQGCSSLTSVTIPNSVTEIGGDIFADCRSLTSVTILGDITEIGWGVFADCRALKTIKIPDSVTEIRENAFKGCSSLTSITIPDSVTEIGENAFKGCSSLGSIRIPDGVTVILNAIFADCTALKRIENCPAGCDPRVLGVSEDCVICHKKGLEGGVLVIPEGTSEIIDEAYCGRMDICKVVIPEGVERIGSGTFASCTFLREITIPNSVNNIDDEAFFGCSSLKAITIPGNVSEIGMGAFGDCSSLTSVTISEGVTEIGEDAFAGCRSLTSITIPGSVTEIGENAFQGCRSLTSVTILGDITEIDWGVFAGCRALKTIQIPDSVTEIGRGAFAGCRLLKSIKIPDGVTEIGNNAFKDCWALQSIEIPENVTKIGWGVFSECRSLTSVTIPDSVTEIGEDAFYHCKSLVSVTIPDSVTEIGGRVFDGCSSLISVRIGRNVTEINHSTFAECTALSQITIPDSVTKIGGYAFENCSALKTATILGSVTEICNGAFQGCCSLAAFEILGNVTEIGDHAFEDCGSLAAIAIPDSTTVIGWSAFGRCSALKSITIPSSVRYIGSAAFAGCTGLKKITLSRRFEDSLADIFADVELSQIAIHWL